MSKAASVVSTPKEVTTTTATTAAAAEDERTSTSPTTSDVAGTTGEKEGSRSSSEEGSPGRRNHPYAANPNQPSALSPPPATGEEGEGEEGEDFGHFDAAANTMLDDHHTVGLPGGSPTGMQSVFSQGGRGGGLQAPTGLGNSPGRGGAAAAGGRGGGGSTPAFKSAFTLNGNAVMPTGYSSNDSYNSYHQQSPYNHGGWQDEGSYSSMTAGSSMMPGMGPSFPGQIGVVAVGGAMVMLPDGTVIPNPAMAAMNGEASAAHLAYLAEEEDVYQKLCDQIEYYFTPENVMKDEFLSQHMSPTGFAPLDVVADFKKVKKMSKDLSVVVASVHRSSKLILRPDWEGRYWAGLYPAVCERSRCTVILLNVPMETTKKELLGLIPELKPYHVHHFHSGTVWYFTFPDAQLARQALFTMQAQAKRTMPTVQVRIRTDNIDRGYGDHEEGPSFANTPSINGANPLPGGLVMQGASNAVAQSAATAQHNVAGQGLYAANTTPAPLNNNHSGGGRGGSQYRGGRGGGHNRHQEEAPDGDGLPRAPQPVVATTTVVDEEEDLGNNVKGTSYSWADDDLGDMSKSMPVQQLVQGSCGEVTVKYEKKQQPTTQPAKTVTTGGLPLALAVDDQEITNFQVDAAKGVKSLRMRGQDSTHGYQQYPATGGRGGGYNNHNHQQYQRGGIHSGANRNYQSSNYGRGGRGGGIVPPQPASVVAAAAAAAAATAAAAKATEEPADASESIPKQGGRTFHQGTASGRGGRGRGGGGHHHAAHSATSTRAPAVPKVVAPKFEASDFPGLGGSEVEGCLTSSTKDSDDAVTESGGAERLSKPVVLNGWAAAVKTKVPPATTALSTTLVEGTNTTVANPGSDEEVKKKKSSERSNAKSAAKMTGSVSSPSVVSMDKKNLPNAPIMEVVSKSETGSKKGSEQQKAAAAPPANDDAGSDNSKASNKSSRTEGGMTSSPTESNAEFATGPAAAAAAAAAAAVTTKEPVTFAERVRLGKQKMMTEQQEQHQ